MLLRMIILFKFPNCLNQNIKEIFLNQYSYLASLCQFYLMETAGAQRGYFKLSMRVTKNQLPNRFHKFVYHQLFNVRYNFVHLQQLGVKFLFSKNPIFCKKKRTAVYGRASLVLDFKPTREIDELLCFEAQINF